MFAGRGGGYRVVGMHLVRRGDVHRFHLGIGAESLHILVDAAAEFRLKSTPRGFPRRTGGHEADTGIRAEGGQHEHERPPQPYNAQSDGIRNCSGIRGQRQDSRSLPGTRRS